MTYSREARVVGVLLDMDEALRTLLRGRMLQISSPITNATTPTASGRTT